MINQVSGKRCRRRRLAHHDADDADRRGRRRYPMSRFHYVFAAGFSKFNKQFLYLLSAYWTEEIAGDMLSALDLPAARECAAAAEHGVADSRGQLATAQQLLRVR